MKNTGSFVVIAVLWLICAVRIFTPGDISNAYLGMIVTICAGLNIWGRE